ncbi:MAG: hypothetical protein KA242_07540 [Chitinophagales bacterium]|jgi:hypothetical protein|nr:hypothetical protein [Chitinophagales bacterium]
MKLILFLTCLLSSISIFAQTHLITLGKGEDCSGFNICSLHPLTQNSKTLPNETPLYITTTKDNKLQFSFPKSKMKETIFLKYFATGLFVLDGDYKVPEDILKQYKIAIIKTGKYKVVATADSYEVVF